LLFGITRFIGHEFVLRLEHLLNVLKFRQKDTREERPLRQAQATDDNEHGE